MPKALTVTLNTGGSGYGISFWEQVYTCATQAFYDMEVKEGSRLGPKSSDTDDTMIGTIYHAFQEIYHKGGGEMRGFDTTTVELRQTAARPWDGPAMIRETAETLFRSYRAKYLPSHMGTIKKVEEPYELPLKKRPWWAPDGMPLTARMDLEVMTTKASCARLGRDHLMVEVGNYIVDFKTAKARWLNMAWAYVWRIQFAFYMMLWQWMNKNKKLKGLIVAAAFKKSNTHEFFLVRPPDLDTQKAVAEVLHTAWERYRADPIGANPFHCMAWGRPCLWGKEGVCKRHSGVFDG